MNPVFKIITITIFSMMILFTGILFGQNQTNQPNKNDSRSLVEENIKSEVWFTVTSVADKVWRIDDHGADNMYLIEGEKKALLIDTGTGMADLAGCIKSITQLPLIVVNTHGHPDHCGSNHQFEEVYANPLDFELIRQFDSKEYNLNAIQLQLKSQPDMASFIVQDTANFKTASLLPIQAGYVFALGNRNLEVIEVPGHTLGSICLLDAQNKLLFTGDNDNVLVWLFLDGCLPLDSYLETLLRLKLRAGEFDTLMPGHGFPLDAAFIDEQIACVQNILSGACRGEDYKSFAGTAKLCTYKRAGVAFNPDNLYTKQ
ncbi:MBL fold metallo-hydrolase [bacterium]|nr:MBL fold metallo-hydrolase [bacterium]